MSTNKEKQENVFKNIFISNVVSLADIPASEVDGTREYLS